MKKTYSILFAIIALIVLSVTSVAFASVKPLSEDELAVGLECNYAPFNWTQLDDSNGAVEIKGGGGFCGGYDVEIAKKIAEGLGRKLVIVKIEWDGLIPAVNAEKIDAVIAGMSPTEERKISVDFSDPYYESDLVIVVKADSEYAKATSIQDFKGAKITAQLNTFHYTVIDQIEGVKKQTAMESFPAMIVALSSGKIDGYISERPGAISAMASNPEFTFVSFEEGKGFVASPEDVAVAVAMKKGNPNISAINEILGKISKEDRQAIMDNAVKTQPALGE
jgi:ABC-type amino acid transport substrate-binding protein